MNTRQVPYLGVLGLIVLLGVICEVAAGGRNTVAQSCRDYVRLSDGTRTALATGYLEGVQAGLEQYKGDILVPPEDRDHPIWWVLPEGEVSSDNLDSALTALCQYAGKDEKLTEAFTSIAERKDGTPRTATAAASDRSEVGRAIIAASRFRCANYLSTSESEKTHFIYGYSLGAKAIGAAMKTPPEESLTADSEYRAVKAKVDAACDLTSSSNENIRDVLLRVTAHMQDRKAARVIP